MRELLEELTRTAKAKGPHVELADILDAIGDRAFGPWLLSVGIIGLSPLAALPTAPSLLAAFTLLVSIQVIAGRRSIWLPDRVKRLSVAARRLETAAKRMTRPARIADRIVHPRLRALTTVGLGPTSRDGLLVLISLIPRIVAIGLAAHALLA